MNIIKANQKYEAWLHERIPLLPADLEHKHELMREAPFPFLRATFYRWAQTWPEVSPKTAAAPLVLGVGDLHVENFGTWRDVEGRLVWGINDFDEACWLPYTCDLVRLATSAHFAIAGDHLKMITPGKASRAILDGYRAALKTGGRVFVLAEHHPVLRTMAVERLKQPELYWEKMQALKTLTGKIPSSAAKSLKRMMPDPKLKFRVVHRVAGLGSLGRLRFVALADWHGGTRGARSEGVDDIGVVMGTVGKTQGEIVLSGNIGPVDSLPGSVRETLRTLDAAAAGAGLLAHRAGVSAGDARRGEIIVRDGI